jgi:hypothetical protein
MLTSPNWVMRAFPLAQCFNSKVEEYISAKIVKTNVRDEILQNDTPSKIQPRKAIVDLSIDEEEDVAKFSATST